jgi:hypothetical protein
MPTARKDLRRNIGVSLCGVTRREEAGAPGVVRAIRQLARRSRNPGKLGLPATPAYNRRVHAVLAYMRSCTTA